MRPSVALQANREAIRALVESRRAFNPRVFGSVLYGSDGEDSDLDLLVDVMPGASMLDICGLQVELEALLGVPVDVATPGDLHRSIREYVVAEAVPI